MATKTKTQKTSKASVKTQKPSDIPEFIEGIPTQRRFKDERRNLVKNIIVIYGETCKGKEKV